MSKGKIIAILVVILSLLVGLLYLLCSGMMTWTKKDYSSSSKAKILNSYNETKTVKNTENNSGETASESESDGSEEALSDDSALNDAQTAAIAQTDNSDNESDGTDDNALNSDSFDDPNDKEPEEDSDKTQEDNNDKNPEENINKSQEDNNDKKTEIKEVEDDFYNPDINLDDYDFAELAPTTTMSFAELVGDNGIYEYPEGFLMPGTYKIIVDLKYQVVMVYKQDEDGHYTVPVRFMICTSGANSSQSPTGTFKMKNYRVRFSLFNNTEVYGQYWSLITGRIYFHSILYSEKNAATYTKSSYNNLGTNVSHGCIRLTVPDARWIYYNCAPGTTVVIRSGKSSDEYTKAIRDKLVIASIPDERPSNLTGDAIPYTDNWRVEDIPHDFEFVQGSQ